LRRRAQALIRLPDIERHLIAQTIALGRLDLGLRRGSLHPIGRLETAEERHIQAQADAIAARRHSGRVLPQRPGAQRQAGPPLGSRHIDTGLRRFQLRFGRLQIRATGLRLGDQGIDRLLETDLSRQGRQFRQANRLLRRQTQGIGQRPQGIARFAFRLDPIQHRLRQCGLRLQTIGRRRHTDRVSGISRLKGFARRAFGQRGRAHRRLCRLRRVIGLQGIEEQRLQRRILRRQSSVEQLRRVLGVRRAQPEIVKEPDQVERRAVAAVGVVLVLEARGSERTVQGGQPSATRHADQRCLRPGCRPDFARLRVVAQGQIDGIQRRQRGRRQGCRTRRSRSGHYRRSQRRSREGIVHARPNRQDCCGRQQKRGKNSHARQCSACRKNQALQFVSTRRRGHQPPRQPPPASSG